MKRPRLYMIGDIDDEMVGRFIPQFMGLTPSPHYVDIILCSDGGDESAGYALYDLISLSRRNTRIIALGSVQSIAAMVFQAATQRVMGPHSRFMVHNGEWNLRSKRVTSDELIVMGRDAADLNYIYHEILSTRSGKHMEEIRSLCRNEAVFVGQDAVDAGFADKVLVTGNANEQYYHPPRKA